MDIREGPLLEGSPSRVRATLLGYLSLTKPRVIELLLVTTIPAMLLANRGTVDPLLILNTLVGGLLAAGLSVAAIAFYVLVYTLLLKRRTSQNIVWGGAAGCMPVVIGWAAVTGTVGWPALVMFGVIFFWTPPHFWALAMRYREDYAAAGVPMLPVVATPVQVSRRIVAYSWVMAAWTLLLLPVTSWVYAVVAVLGGTWFVLQAHRLHASVVAGH